MKNKGIIKAATLRDDELKSVLAEQRNALYDLRAQTVTEKVEDTSSFKRTRANIARILTEARARQIKAAGPAPAKADSAAPAKPAKKPVAKKAAASSDKPAAKKPAKAAAKK